MNLRERLAQADYERHQRFSSDPASQLPWNQADAQAKLIFYARQDEILRIVNDWLQEKVEHVETVWDDDVFGRRVNEFWDRFPGT